MESGQKTLSNFWWNLEWELRRLSCMGSDFMTKSRLAGYALLNSLKREKVVRIKKDGIFAK